ncbi:MAG: hypothetical protein ACKO2K_11730 [Alphaproteobacteria bacterium]
MRFDRLARIALCVAALAGFAIAASPARAFDTMGYMSRPDCEPQTGERPYVCDVGLPRPLTPLEFRRLLTRNGAIRRHVGRIGLPDYAEIQKVAVDSPWRPEEIRLYYLDFDRMYSFGRAMILESPEVSILRYQGPIPSGRGPIR